MSLEPAADNAATAPAPSPDTGADMMKKEKKREVIVEQKTRKEKADHKMQKKECRTENVKRGMRNRKREIRNAEQKTRKKECRTNSQPMGVQNGTGIRLDLMNTK